MGKKTENCYVDTSAFIAFLDRSDTYHSLFARLFSSPPKLFTTPLVIAEAHAWFLRRYDATRALQFVGFYESLTPLIVKSVGQSELSESSKLLRKFPDQSLTIVDAVGLFLIRENKIKTTWSTDRHLSLTGARLVIHD